MAGNDRYIGGLWNSTSRSGVKYMKGSLTVNDEVVRIVIFKNTRKNKRTHPDYTIMSDIPIEPKDIMSEDDDTEGEIEAQDTPEDVPEEGEDVPY